MTRGGGPPRWVVGLLGWLTPREDRDFVLGDLEEEFRERQARSGRRRATLWGCVEVVRSARTLTTYATGNGEGMMMVLGSYLPARLVLSMDPATTLREE